MLWVGVPPADRITVEIVLIRVQLEVFSYVTLMCGGVRDGESGSGSCACVGEKLKCARERGRESRTVSLSFSMAALVLVQ